MNNKKNDLFIGKLFIVSAPSGAGKTSLVDNIINTFGKEYNIERLITYTSRQIRHGEEHGKDFYFVTKQEFEERIEQGFFIEWSLDYGHYYGSPASVKGQIESGVSKVLVIDRNGAKQVIRGFSDAVTIWIFVQSVDILRHRLLKRGLNTIEQIEQRLKIAQQELLQETRTNLYKYHVLNDDFYEATEKLKEIFLKELINL